MYNLKKNSQLYLVYAGQKYQLDIYPDVSTSQTFAESSYAKKTLHQPLNLSEGATITKANPVNFNFTCPIYEQNDLSIISSLLMNYNTDNSIDNCDLYFVSDTETYKVEKAVFTGGVFQFVSNAVVTININGTGAKLTKFVGTIPGTLVTRNPDPIFVAIKRMTVSIEGTTQERIAAVSLEIQNDITWVEYDTVHNSLNINGDYNNTAFPSSYVLSGRQVTGSVQQFITDEGTNNKVNSWKIGVPLRIRIGNTTSYSIDINLQEVVYTNRLNMQELYLQSYDFRLLSNPTQLASYITLSDSGLWLLESGVWNDTGTYSDSRIWMFGGSWLLDTGLWDDDGEWTDDSVWNFGVWIMLAGSWNDSGIWNDIGIFT